MSAVTHTPATEHSDAPSSWGRGKDQGREAILRKAHRIGIVPDNLQRTDDAPGFWDFEVAGVECFSADGDLSVCGCGSADGSFDDIASFCRAVLVHDERTDGLRRESVEEGTS